MPDPFPEPAEGRYTPTRRRFLSLAGLALGGGVLGLGATGCGTAQTGSSTGGSSAKGRPGASGDTLFVSGFQWGPPTSFNPLGASPAWPAGQGQSQLVYETLLRFNLIDGSLQPGLGRELQQTDAKTLTVPLQEGTAWSDGSELTADDVVFSYELSKQVSTSYSSVWTYLDSVTAKDARTVVFTLKDKPYNPGSVKDSLSKLLIVPKAVWSTIDSAKITAETNLKPVGSGPYTLDKADQTQVSLTRADTYWGKTVYGTPAPLAIVHPIFKTGNDGDIKLQSGEIDASQQFTPQIWKMWEDKQRPVATWLKDKPLLPAGQHPAVDLQPEP
ncbi:ABC transporter substrate-binding protein [uncultured Friedmanniella sp.]|uniref:ABC transporter substrate-binding protein n=1 Tax=uncultured Friedmanniella sp. TaxID=335381 RepID=UPI0035CA86CF